MGWNELNTDRTYWSNHGKDQDIYNKMETAVDKGEWDWNKTTVDVFRRYYRFYNDGDCPNSMKYRLQEYADMLEAKADDRVLKEWKRFIRSHH